MDDAYELIVAGTGFASSFFLHRFLERSGPGARVLVLCRASALAGDALPEEVVPAAAVVLADRPRPDAARPEVLRLLVASRGGQDGW